MIRSWLLRAALLCAVLAQVAQAEQVGQACNTGGWINTIGNEFVATRAPTSLTGTTRYYMAVISCRVTDSTTNDGVVERGPWFEIDSTPTSFLEGINPLLSMGSASVLVASCGSAAYAIDRRFRGSITNTREGTESVTLTFDAETRQQYPVGQVSEAPFNGTFTGGFSTHPSTYGDAYFCEASCACDENLSNGECVPMAVNTSIDWLASKGLYLYPDNNHDHAPRCEPRPLNEVDACPTDGSSPEAGNPIDCATGRKVQTETDYRGHGLDPLVYQRTYRSPEPMSDDEPDTGSTLPGWANVAIPSFSVTTYDDGSQLAYLSVGEWYRRAFYRKSTELSWQTNPYLPSISLSPNGAGGGFRITTQRGQSYDVNAAGQVEQRLDREQPRYEYQHADINGTSQVVQVRNRLGASLTFSYEGPDGALSRLTDQDGLSIHYQYDALGNLTDVVYPDSTPAYLDDNPRKTYLYEHPDLPHHLTGILDESGQRFATFAYDEDGRAIRTEHADGAERVEVQYPAEGEAIVRFYQDSDTGLYREEHYTYGKFRGAHRLTSKTVTLCQDCTIGTETWRYNAEGLLERHTSPGGQITEWTYDDQGRKLTETVAVGTPDARTTTFTWNDQWHRHQTVETDTHLTTYVYDSRGHRVETIVTPKD